MKHAKENQGHDRWGEKIMNTLQMVFTGFFVVGALVFSAREAGIGWSECLWLSVVVLAYFGGKQQGRMERTDR